ncbi:MAG: hypothetical protein KGQ51_16195 [Planctomycetes bacterium]|nr:hypothetical protein [Planctomycetota bacterium]
MSYLHTKHVLNLLGAVRALVFATVVFGSYSWGQVPCEPRSIPRHSVKPVAQPATPSVDWTTMPSTYTHDATGQRVDQYALGVEPEAVSEAGVVRSGFTHTRSSLQVGFNSDHYHVTEQWGDQVRPYGEWRFPYRPFSVPYGAWGPQLPQVSVQGLGVYPWGVGPGQPHPGQPHPGQGHPWPQHPGHPGMGGAAGAGAPVAGAPAGAGGAGAAGGGVGMGPMGGMGPGMGPMVPGPGVPAGHSGMHPGYGYPQGVPWWGYPGVSPYAPYGGVGPYGVGPANGLSPIQEDYYPQAPIYQHPSDGYFHSPYRPGP